MADEDLISITGGPLKPHEFVLVKPYMTADDEAWIQDHSARLGKDALYDDKSQIIFTVGAVQLATAKRMVKGWSLTKAVTINGETRQIPIPFSVQNVGTLPRSVYKFILKKIAEMNPDEEEEAESDKDFSLVVVDSSEESLDAERVVRRKH